MKRGDMRLWLIERLLGFKGPPPQPYTYRDGARWDRVRRAAHVRMERACHR
jgi:hypothetical protein